MIPVKIFPDGAGGFIASGLPDGITRHVYVGNVTVRVAVTDDLAQPLGEMEFLIPYVDVHKLSLMELSARYGSTLLSWLKNYIKVPHE